jgi:hypothetical protein
MTGFDSKRTAALDRLVQATEELGLYKEPDGCCSECGKQKSDGWALYCVGCIDQMNTATAQEPVAWPAGLINRIKAAEQRIQDGHALRRIPADPTDVDLVLAEVRHLLEGKQPPFWIAATPPASQPAQEPVAWGMPDKDGGIQATITPQQYAKLGHNYNVPLYTTPQQPVQEPVARGNT